MKYFITFKTLSTPGFLSGRSIFNSSEYTEHTWVATEETLQETLERVAVNKHTVVRIVKGFELDFKQGVQITSLAPEVKEL